MQFLREEIFFFNAKNKNIHIKELCFEKHMHTVFLSNVDGGSVLFVDDRDEAICNVMLDPELL